jgi:iron complex transport system permease protein
VSFVGLVVPHLVRLLAGPDHRAVLPGSALLGGSLILGADLVARTAVAPAELPLGVVTAALGAPFFLWLLLRNKRSGGLG